MTYNCITDTTLLSVLRYGSTPLVAGAGETLTNDVGKQVAGVPLKYTKVAGGVLAEMTAGEKTSVDDGVPKRDSLLIKCHRGTKEILNGDGAISPLLFSTRLTKGSEQAMTLADGTIDGLMKSIRTASDTPATITCALDQDIGAYVSFSMDASGHIDLVWYDDEGYWDVCHYKQITWNT